METRYTTKKGSVYIHTRTPASEYWVKEDGDGSLHSLAGGVHIALAKLQELIDEYPRTMLDKTFCFNIGVEKEFFDDAKREEFTGPIGAEPTVIFFLVQAADRYAIGCSSEIVTVSSEQ